MKKVLAILLTLAMVLAFAACGAEEETTTAAPEESTSEEATEEATEATSEEATEEATEATSEEATSEEASEEESSEETTEASKGLNSTNAAEVVAYYNAAHAETNKQKIKINGSNKMKLDGDITADGGLGTVLKLIMPVIEKTLERNSSTQDCLPGQGKILASDCASAKATSKNGITTIYIKLKDQTDGPNADPNTAGPVARGISTLGDVERAINELGAEVYSGKENIKLTYNDAYIEATIDENTGVITGGKWHFKVNVNITAIELKLVVKIKANNFKGIIDWTVNI